MVTASKLCALFLNIEDIIVHAIDEYMTFNYYFFSIIYTGGIISYEASPAFLMFFIIPWVVELQIVFSGCSIPALLT